MHFLVFVSFFMERLCLKWVIYLFRIWVKVFWSTTISFFCHLYPIVDALQLNSCRKLIGQRQKHFRIRIQDFNYCNILNPRLRNVIRFSQNEFKVLFYITKVHFLFQWKVWINAIPRIVLYRIGASTANLNNTCSNHIQNSCYICVQRKTIFYFSFILYIYFFTLCHVIVSFSLLVFSL